MMIRGSSRSCREPGPSAPAGTAPRRASAVLPMPRAQRRRAPPTDTRPPPGKPAHAPPRKRRRQLARRRRAHPPRAARAAPPARAPVARRKRRRAARHPDGAHLPPVRAAPPRQLRRQRLPGRDSSARVSERAERCIHRQALSWLRPPLRSSASWPKPDCRRESACSKTCSRACRSEPARSRERAARGAAHRPRSAICILPRNAEPLRLRSRWTGDPTRTDVDPLGRIGPAGP